MQLTVRNLGEELVRLLKERAAKHNRSAEGEHREILRQSLLGDGRGQRSFAERAVALRSRLKSRGDSTALIRAERDRDSAQ